MRNGFTQEIRGRRVQVEVRRKKRKTLKLMAAGKDHLQVECPSRCTHAEVGQVLRAHELRVLRMLDAWSPPPPAPEVSSEALKVWAQAGYAALRERMDECCREVGLSPTYLRVKEVSSIWGSCTAKRGINLNIRLLYCPREIVRYILIHELCHLRHPNHSVAFWQMVGQYDPEVKAHRAWLRQHGAEVTRLPLGLPMRM